MKLVRVSEVKIFARCLPSFLGGEWIETLNAHHLVAVHISLPSFLGGEWIETNIYIRWEIGSHQSPFLFRGGVD